MPNPSSKLRFSRRQFLAATGAAVVFPSLVPSRVLGGDGATAPSNQIVMGVVGCGGMGMGNTRSFLSKERCRVVAACDVDQNHLDGAVKKINDRYQNQDCKGYRDFREVMARKDIDAVMLAVPDHWHELIAVEAASHKKDIYGEKPLARTIAEQQAIVKAVQKNNRIWQTGSWQRSYANFQKAAEIVRNGLIGQVTRVEVGLPGGQGGKMAEKDMLPSEPPAELDYDRWIGPSKLLPYIAGRIHGNWRWNYNTGGGQLLDWIGHHCDIAHWGCDFDRSGPSEIEGQGEFPPADAVWNSCTRYRAELKYPGNVTMIIAGGHADIRDGTKWIGTEGWVWVNRGQFQGSKEEWRDSRELPEELRKVKLYTSRDHHGNFLDCVVSRKPTITPAETAHHSAIPGHLSLISMLVGRKIRWDVKSERILDDPAASQLLSRPFRPPWKLS